MNQKRKGNSFENKCAKELSEWMFDDKNVLKKHPSSGGDKSIWSGDIIPLKQINWNSYPFFIEAKHGYKDRLPTFYSWAIINEWMTKALLESSNSIEQHIVWIICKFHGKKTLLISTYPFDINIIIPMKILPYNDDGEIIWLYTYDYKTLLETNFKDLNLI